MLPAFLTTILFSISAISGNRASKLLSGTEANLWRLVFATILLGLYAHLRGGGLGGASFTTFLISGCIGFGIGDLALYQALPRIGSRLSVMLVLCLSSPISAAMEWAWMGTSLTVAQIASAVVVLVGVATAVAPSEHLEKARGIIVTGIIFGIIAAVCQAVGAVLSRQAFAIARGASESIDAMTAAYQRILGGVLVTALFLLIIKADKIKALFTQTAVAEKNRGAQFSKALPWMLLNAVTGPALGVTLYQMALKVSPTGIVLPIVALTPVVIIPFSLWFEHERPTRRSIIGGFIAVLGAAALAMVRSK